MKYISYIFFFFGLVLGLASAWVYFNFGTVTIPQVMTNLSRMGAISTVFYLKFFGFVILPSCILIFLNKKICLGLVLLSLVGANFVFNISSYILNKNVYSSLYEDEFVRIKAEKIAHPLKKKNLVVIYVESLEEQYSDPQYSGEVLTPYLQTQKNEALHFGGYYQLPTTKYTLAGTMGSECGIKDNFDFGTSASVPNLYPQIACIPDILAQNGYQTFFYQSADLDFANTAYFARQHHFHEIKGSAEWKEKDPDLLSGSTWGIRDSILFARAKEKILELQKSDRPYFMALATIETHSGETFVDPICKLKEKTPQNTVKCADILLRDFIEWCKNQPFYEDMTIVVVGDHTAHGETNEVYHKQPQNRRIENLIFNAVREDKKEHQWTTFDLAPTIMEAIGYDMPALGLGRSLFADEPTVFEKYGRKFNVLLQQNSRFLQKLSEFSLPNIDDFFKIEIGKTYQSETELKRLAPYSNQTYSALGRLWLKHLNLEVTETRDYKLLLEAIAMKKQPRRNFEVFANGIKIGDMLFENSKSGKFEITIPKEVIKNGKITLNFENSELKHWNITSLGIGIGRITLK